MAAKNIAGEELEKALGGDLLEGIEQEDKTDCLSSGFDSYYNALDSPSLEELKQLSKTNKQEE